MLLVQKLIEAEGLQDSADMDIQRGEPPCQVTQFRVLDATTSLDAGGAGGRLHRTVGTEPPQTHVDFASPHRDCQYGRPQYCCARSTCGRGPERSVDYHVLTPGLFGYQVGYHVAIKRETRGWEAA